MFGRGRTGAAPGRGPASPRVLLYSHDTFGLGHLRRSRAIAQSLVAARPGLSALILTGSPVAGRFAFPEGVDHVRLPGVVKTPDGEYLSQSLKVHVDATTELRARLIEAAVDSFDPHLVIVDKEPTGFRGELLSTLRWLSAQRRTKVVLGLRDVLDAPETLGPEWDRKGALAAAERYFDEIWVYGLSQIYDPLRGVDASPALRRRVRYTGYLRREINGGAPGEEEQPYILVTPGGGGDGEALVDWVLSAYESDPTLEPRALIVYGPFLNGERRAELEARVAALGSRVAAYGFVSNMEALMTEAAGVVAMGGYNTFCEILSFDKPAVLAPRFKPRREQQIRAKAADSLGLVRMIDPESQRGDPRPMIEAIRGLAEQAPPSSRRVPGLLGGLPAIVDRVSNLLESAPRSPLAHVG